MKKILEAIAWTIVWIGTAIGLLLLLPILILASLGKPEE